VGHTGLFEPHKNIEQDYQTNPHYKTKIIDALALFHNDPFFHAPFCGHCCGRQARRREGGRFTG
jgi:hypothetical protein